MFKRFRRKPKISATVIASDLLNMLAPAEEQRNQLRANINIPKVERRFHAIVFIYCIGTLLITKSHLDAQSKDMLLGRFLEVLTYQKGIDDSAIAALFLHKAWAEFQPSLSAQTQGAFPPFFTYLLRKCGVEVTPDNIGEVSGLLVLTLESMDAISEFLDNSLKATKIVE